MENNVESINKKSNDAIVVTNEHLNNPQFTSALRTMNSKELPIKAAYAIGCICSEVDKLIVKNRNVFSAMAKKYAKLDEKGNIEPEKDEKGNPIFGSLQFKDDESKEMFNKEVEDFSTIEHTVNQKKIDVGLLHGVAMSGRDISVLEPLLCGLEN